MQTEGAHKFNLYQSSADDVVAGPAQTNLVKTCQFYGSWVAVLLVSVSMYYCFTKQTLKAKKTVEDRVLNTESSEQFLNDQHIAQL